MQSTPTFDPAATPGPRPAAAPGRRVTDAPTRMFHWLFALSFLGAYLTADGERWRALHVTLGYTLAGLLAFRIVYGLLGPRHASLGVMWRRLGGARTWLQSVAQSRSIGAINWRQGQNLLMALATAALLAIVVPVTLSGYATYNDWGGEWLEELHEFFGNAFLAVLLGHLALIAALSVLRRRNLAAPMLTGRIQGPGPDVAKPNRRWLAAVLLCAVLGYGAWEWRQAPNGLVPGATWGGGAAAPHAAVAKPSRPRHR